MARVIARWRMTANGQALDAMPARVSPDVEAFIAAAPHDARIFLEHPEDIATALERGLVDEVECRIEPLMAMTVGDVVTGGNGAATVAEGWRLMRTQWTQEGESWVLRGQVSR